MAEKETVWKHQAHGNVEIYMIMVNHPLGQERNSLAIIHGNSATKLEEAAQKYLDDISWDYTEEEMSRIGYSIRFGMTPALFYKEDV